MALLDICTRESEVWVMAEALDAIMDIFAEDETDCIAEEIKLVDKLQTLVPVLINKVINFFPHMYCMMNIFFIIR